MTLSQSYSLIKEKLSYKLLAKTVVSICRVYFQLWQLCPGQRRHLIANSALFDLPYQMQTLLSDQTIHVTIYAQLPLRLANK